MRRGKAMFVEVHGNIYKFVRQKKGMVCLQSVNDDSHLEVDYTTFLHSPEYKPVDMESR